jgi:leader peptidase (prepilin peptidase) / N-methyltransferase
MAWAHLWIFSQDWTSLLFGTVFLACVADIVIADWQIMIVPDRSVAGMFIAGWLDALAASGWDSAELIGSPALDHILRSLFLGGGVWLLARSYRWARKRDGLGLGDIKLIAAAGAWLSFDLALDAITLAAVGALVGIGVLAYIQKTNARLSQEIPFAVFLAPAFWLVWAVTH